MTIDEASPSGWPKQMQDRIERYLNDYRSSFNELRDEFKKDGPDLITLKDLTNKLLNLDPYATYAWKTTAKASQSSLSGKGENTTSPTWDQMHDPAPSHSIKNPDAQESFLKSRKEMFYSNFS